MNYDDFLQVVASKLQKEVDPAIEIMQRDTTKNNGVVYKGFMFSQLDVNVSPTIYMEEYYKLYCEGKSLDEIVERVLELYNEIKVKESWKDLDVIKYERVKHKIVMRLIHREFNRELLMETPYLPFLDLAIVFCVLLDANSYGTVSMTVGKEHLAMWGVTLEELYARAKKNTPNLLPEDFVELCAFIEKATGRSCSLMQNTMYVLSNRIKNFGATAILYPQCLKKIGDYLKDDFYMIPSSIHEVIIVPKQFAIEESIFSEMIQHVNEDQLEPDEILSDHVYYYERKNNRLGM